MRYFLKTIAIAGASGFIGSHLIKALLDQYGQEVKIVALSRNRKSSDDSRIEWRKCDLFSLKDVGIALEGCTEAIYLVHSMLPSASLSQGAFYDFDLIIADNFRRAAQNANLSHILYLGGMIPKVKDLSWHLKSRLEVEQVLRAEGMNMTTLRAGLIMGAKGSSFVILQRLIDRLPVMLCPTWTLTKSQPVDLRDVIKVILRVLEDRDLQGKTYDIAGPEVLTYLALMETAAGIMKKNRTFLSIQLIPLTISRFWVSLITQVPKDLVYPLVLSLKYEMVASEELQYPYRHIDLQTPLVESLEAALVPETSFSSRGYVPVQKDVRSIQRLTLPKGKDAIWVAKEYVNWLPTHFNWIVRTSYTEQGDFRFFLLHPRIELLVLRVSPERSSPDRQLLYIIGGLLAGVQERGRLEFREALDKQYIMAAIHEFRPALPWWIYRWTQAVVHLWVMRSFEKHLKKIARNMNKKQHEEIINVR